ncbi:MAG: hypothetical protein ACK5Q5_03740 [Planctomycetaceae bacterium]
MIRTLKFRETERINTDRVRNIVPATSTEMTQTFEMTQAFNDREAERTNTNRVRYGRLRWGAGMPTLCIALGTLCLALLLAAAAEGGDDTNDRFIESLLDRGLVQTAENEALRRLSEPGLSPVDRVRWSLRLAQAYMRHAGETTGQDRQELAQRAEQTLAQLRMASPPLPRQAEILAIQASLKAEHARSLAWEWQFGDNGEPARDIAVAKLQSAIDELKVARSQLQAAAPRPAAAASAELTAVDLRRLDRDLEHELAQTLIRLAELTPAGPDRDPLLSTADQLLQPLANGWTGDTRTWEARLLRVRTARLRGELDLAASQVRAALESRPETWLVDRLVAEQVRVQIDAGRLDVALETLLKQSRERHGLTGELQSLQVDALLAAARLADQKREAATATELRTQAESIAIAMPGNWGSAARLRNTRELEVGRLGPQVAQVVQAARAAYQSGDVAGATQLFGQASSLAIKEGRNAAADELDYTRGSLLVSKEQFAAAADVLEQLLTRSPQALSARDADLLRAYAVGKLAQETKDPALSQRYVTLLTQHRERYAGSPSAAEASWMQATFEEARRKWSQALGLYLSMATDPNRGPEAQQRCAILYAEILTELRRQGQDLNAWEDRAVKDLTTFVRSYPMTPAELTLIQADVTLRLVGIVLGHREHLYAEATRLLKLVPLAVAYRRRQAEQSQAPLADAWQQIGHNASQLMIVSLAGQGLLDQAREQFRQLSLTDPGELLSLLEGLSKLTADIPADQRQQLAELQLDAAREMQIRRNELSPAQQQQLDAAVAEAYLASGNVLNAVTFYDKLLEQKPQDRERLQTAAGLHQQIGDAAHLQTARKYWQRLEGLSPKGTPDWFESRLHTAECLAAQGEGETARKLVQVTRLVYPDLGGPALQAAFGRVEDRIGQRANQP